MESVKAVVEEVKCISGYSHSPPNPENSFCGGCCEGTVFTFTSAASNGKLRQRLRYRAAALKSHGRKEEATDSVFSEMRMMPPSREKSSAHTGDLYSTQDLQSRLSDAACKISGADFIFQRSQGSAQNRVHKKQSDRRVGREKSEEFCNLAEEASVASLEQREVLEDEGTHLRGRNFTDSHRNGERISKRGCGRRDKGLTSDNLDDIGPKGGRRVQYTDPSIDDRKDERNHKRYSSSDQVNTFQQRKFRCARQREKELVASRIERARSEYGCRAEQFQAPRTELRMTGLAESEGRLQIEAELRILQERQHVTSLKWNMIKKGQARVSEQADDAIKNLDSGVCNEITMEVVSKKEDNRTENEHCNTILPAFASRRSLHVSPSNSPLACSFISFKGGISGLQGKTFSFGGETITRAESSARQSEGTVTCMTTVSSTKSFCYESVGAQSMEVGHLVQELSRAQSGLSFGSTSSTLVADTEIKTTKTFEDATTIDRDATVPAEVEGHGDQSLVIKDATWNRPSGKGLVRFTDPETETMTSSNVLDKLSSDMALPRELKERIRESKLSVSICEEQECSWSTVMGKSGEGERLCGDRANKRRPQQSRQRRSVVNDRSTSMSLDWYGSRNDIDRNIQQRQREEAGGSPPYSDHAIESNNDLTEVSTDVSLGIGWKDSKERGTQKVKQEYKTKLRKVPEFEVQLRDDTSATAAFQGNAIAVNMHSTDQSQIENKQETCVINGTCRLKSHRHHLERKCDLACSRQRNLPIRHVCKRSFKKKTEEKISYFEKWLRRGKREASLRKQVSNSGGNENGVNRVDKHRDSLSLGLQVEEMPETFPLNNEGKRRITSSASSKNGYNTSYVLKRSVNLECVVASELSGKKYESDSLDYIRGEAFLSFATIPPKSSNNESTIPRSKNNPALGNGEFSFNQNLVKKERLDTTKAYPEGNLTEQPFVGNDEKYEMATEVSTGKVEPGHVPTSTSISTFQGTEKAKSMLFPCAFSSRDDDATTLTDMEDEATTNVNREHESFGDRESGVCVHVRLRSSTCGHQNSVQVASDDFLLCTQGLTRAESYGVLSEKSVSNEKGPQDSLKGDATDERKANTCTISRGEITNPSLLFLKCPNEPSQEEKLMLRTVQNKSCRRIESQQSSGISSWEKEFSNKGFSMDCPDSVLVGAASEESFRGSEESATNDFPKHVISRKQKTPIVVRVRNGLANGWLLQSYIWKKFAKQKVKTTDSQSTQSKDVSRKENIEPLRTSSPGLVDAHVVGAFAAAFNSNTRGSKVKGVHSPDQSMTRGDKVPRSRNKVAEVVATPKIPSSENVMCAPVRSTSTGTENIFIEEIRQDTEENKIKSDSTCEVDKKAEHVLAVSESLAIFEERNSEERTSGAIPESGTHGHKDLQQQSLFSDVHDTQAREPKTFGNVNEETCFREVGLLSGKSDKFPDRRGNRFPRAVNSEAACDHEKGTVLTEVSPKLGELRCQKGVNPLLDSSNQDASPTYSKLGSTEYSRRLEKVSETFQGEKRHQDIGNNMGNCIDHNVAWVQGRTKRSASVNKSRCELFSPLRPDSTVSADAHGEDPVCPLTLDDEAAISGEAAILSLFTDIESRVHPFKHLSGLLPASTKNVLTSSQASFNLEKWKDLPPAILKSGNACSSSLKHNSLATKYKDRSLSPGEKVSKHSSVLRQDNNLQKIKARSGCFAGFSQRGETEKSSDIASKTNQLDAIHTGSKPWSSPLDERNARNVPQMMEAPERYDDKVPTGQLEGLEEASPVEAQSVPSSPKNDESNNADRGKAEGSKSSKTHETSWILVKHMDGWEREEDAKNRNDSESSTCQPDTQNRFDCNSPGLSAPSKISSTKRPDERKDSDVRTIQEPGRAGSWVTTDQDIHWHGPTCEKGNAHIDSTSDSVQLPAVQGFWDCHSHSLESTVTENRETHGSTLSLDQLSSLTSRSQNRFVDPIPWNEAKRSSTAPTLQTPLHRLRFDNAEVFQQQQAWNPLSTNDFQTHNHVVQKDVREYCTIGDGHTQDEVFLERFSSINDPHDNKMRHRRESVNLSLAVPGALRAPTSYAPISVRDETGSFPSQDKVVLGRKNLFSFNRKVQFPVSRTLNSLLASPSGEPPAPHPNEAIQQNPSIVDAHQQPLPCEVERANPKSIIVPNSNYAYHTYETGFLSELRNSFSSVSPCSSINGCPENTSDKISLKPHLCLHGSTAHDPGVPWGHYSDEALDFKTCPTQSSIQSIPPHLPPSLDHNPTLTTTSQTFRSSCHTAARTFGDPCNYNSCSNSSCNNQFPVCGPMLRQPQYQSGSEHTIGHRISARPTETAISQHMRVPVSHGYVCHYAPNVGRYAPPQTMPIRQSSWPASDKHISSNKSGDTGAPDSDSALGKEQNSGLVWLTGEEMNLIRELRRSVGKESTKSSECLPDPEPSPFMSFSSTATGVREGSFYAGGSNISHASSISRCSNFSSCTSPRQIHEAGITTHLELTRDSLLKRWITSMQKAASIIQRAWRALLRRRRDKAPSVKALPKNMKDFHELIKTRQSSKNYCAPSLDNFVRSIKYIQARTEGARIRRRLKSRRLQAIIMEIKEIRNLLSEMSEEANRDASAPYLYPQLCNQLQQKILQFHTALTGPQMQARFLLRRGPATPLVLCPSKSQAANALKAVNSHNVGDQHHSRMLTAFQEPKPLHTHPVTTRRRGSRAKVRPSAVKSENSLTEPPESAKLLPWYFLAQRSPSKPITGRSSPTEFTSSFHESHVVKKEPEEAVLDSSSSQVVNKGILPYQPVPVKGDPAESNINDIYEEQPLSLMQRRKASDLSFDEIPIGTANAGMLTVDFGPSVDVSNKPKRPFLKRKSIMMAPQKLDWSKVKPMVSSRLEPELKTKLSYCRHTKAVDRPSGTSTSRRRKENYSQVKSRLFSYAENPSPSSSKGTPTRGRYNEQDDIETSPPSRGGSFVEGTSESGESSRLADYRRPASPDLLRLKSQVQADTEAELAYHRVQASITDPQIEPTYRSRFDSARYLHKLGNSEQAAKDSSMQAAQPRTQRIRLRLIPGSEENEPGRVLVQKIETQEEEMPDLWHDQRIAMRNRRRQSHSHRYASYRDSSQGDAQPSTKLDESRRPSPPSDRRTLKACASSKMGLASKELEEMFERVIAANCGTTSNLYRSQLGGRNITLSDLFERTQR